MTEHSIKIQDQHPIELLILAFFLVSTAIIDLWQALHLVYSRELALQRREARTNVLVPLVEQVDSAEALFLKTANQTESKTWAKRLTDTTEENVVLLELINNPPSTSLELLENQIEDEYSVISEPVKETAATATTATAAQPSAKVRRTSRAVKKSSTIEKP